MSAQTERRTGRWRKATALVPLALLSAAFTASIAGANAPAVVASGAHSADTTLPDGTAVPTQAIEAPASVSNGDGLGLGDGNAAQIVSTASTSGIPSAALSAYQRAETVINAADQSCNLTWQLIAAIGRVESNHGRANGNVLDNTGLAVPGIYGIALNGSNKTAEILDTDAGQYDNDTTYDRAVGPMQFIPSTWSVVGVDADGDGVRNPQDVDDAALGTAVYLCSGSDDLGTDAGRQAAVFRYNHSPVLRRPGALHHGGLHARRLHLGAQQHRGGRLPGPRPRPGRDRRQRRRRPGHQDARGRRRRRGPGRARPSPPTPTEPSNNGDGGNGNGNGNTNNAALPPVDVPELPSTSVEPVDEVLTEVQAIAQCLADGLNQLLNPAAFAGVRRRLHDPQASLTRVRPASPRQGGRRHGATGSMTRASAQRLSSRAASTAQ